MKIHTIASVPVTILLSAVSSLCALPNAKPGTQDAATNSPPQVIILASMAFLNDEHTMALATEWMFDKSELGRPFLIEPTAGQIPGQIAAILTTSQCMATLALLERGRSLHSFPGKTLLSGRHAHIELDDGESLHVTPVIATDGLSVEVSIAASITDLAVQDRQSFRQTSVTATVRDGQALMLGEAKTRKKSEGAVKYRSKLILVRVSVIDGSGKPLHLWEERNGTRFYWDMKPHAQPAIPPQGQPR